MRNHSITSKRAIFTAFVAPAAFFLSATAYASAQSLLASSAPAPYSTSEVVPSAPSASSAEAALRPEQDRLVSTRAFSALAVRLGVSSGGIGAELATPLSRRVNLRAGTSILSTGFNPTISGVDVLTHVHMASAFGTLDIHPFRGAFRVSTGITFFNDVNAVMTGTLAPGSSFSLGDTNYVSSPGDPLNGWAQVNLGKKIAPRLTIGWGNLIPHHPGQHFSMPIEIGAHYVGAPTVLMSVNGSACDSQNQCGPVSMGETFQADLQTEVAKFKKTISPFAIVPIISTGLSYKF